MYVWWGGGGGGGVGGGVMTCHSVHSHQKDNNWSITLLQTYPFICICKSIHIHQKLALCNVQQWAQLTVTCNPLIRNYRAFFIQSNEICYIISGNNCLIVNSTVDLIKRYHTGENDVNPFQLMFM
jgi:hypothetical protein